MRNKLFILTWIVFILFGSCMSSPGSNSNSSSSDSQWFFSLEKADLEPGEIRSITNENVNITAENIPPFGKIAWLYSLLETFDLHEKLSINDKIILLDALFNNIPNEANSIINRATAIGDYFGENKHLILYSTNFMPSDKAPEGSRMIVDFTGNFIVTEDVETGETKFTHIQGMISPKFNWFSNGIVFTNSNLVKVTFLSNDEEYMNALENRDAVSLINLMDSYTKDENAANDSDILALLAEAEELIAGDPMLEVFAKLNHFQYLIYIEDTENAQLLLEEIQAQAVDITDEGFRRIIDIEAPHMLELMNYLLSG
jgi:hypothetical protein